MNTKRYVSASICVFLFIFIYEWIFHGVFLKDAYLATAALWRPRGESIMSVMFLAQILFAFVFGFIFIKGFENKGLGEGFRYGLLIGLLFTPGHLMFYAVQPLPLNLVAAWIVGGIIESILAGLIVAGVYRK